MAFQDIYWINIMLLYFLVHACLIRLSFVNLVADLTDNPAVPALQCWGGTGNRTVGAVLVASLSRHGRREGGAGAACRGRGSAAGQGGAWADPLILALEEKHIHAFLKALFGFNNSISTHGYEWQSTMLELLMWVTYKRKCHLNIAVFKSPAPLLA